MQDLLFAARPLGGFDMWAHGLHEDAKLACLMED